MRIGILGLLHESNTFVSRPTELRDFEQETLLEGSAIRDRFAPAHHEVGGFFEALAGQCDVVPVFMARALPSGTISSDCWSVLMERLFAALDRAGRLDGLLVAVHGATVSRDAADADGTLLGLLRQRVGHGVPLLGTLDPHANLSPQMVTAADGLVAYRTNPHVDQRARGIEAAELLLGTLRGQLRPCMRACFPPLVINIERQSTGESPLRELLQSCDDARRQPGMLSTSLILGFPYADVPEMGAGIIAISNGDDDLAQRTANALGKLLWEQRRALEGRLHGVAEAIQQACALPGPVGLLDMGDNVGGGSPADGTILAHALHERGGVRSLVCLCDPAAVRAARAAGAGARLALRVGGWSDQQHGPPLEADFLVESLHDGRFREAEPRHGGFSEFDQGPTAVVAADSGLTVMLTTHRMTPFSQQQMLHCRLDPARFQILVLKGVHAPLAAYRDVCKSFLRVNTPGSTSADLAQHVYRHRRRPLFPFEPEAEW